MVDKETIFIYLDALRESGITNMFGAGPYIEDEFDLPEREARALLVEWMKTYSERRRRNETGGFVCAG